MSRSLDRRLTDIQIHLRRGPAGETLGENSPPVCNLVGHDRRGSAISSRRALNHQPTNLRDRNCAGTDRQFVVRFAAGFSRCFRQRCRDAYGNTISADTASVPGRPRRSRETTVVWPAVDFLSGATVPRLHAPGSTAVVWSGEDSLVKLIPLRCARLRCGGGVPGSGSSGHRICDLPAVKPVVRLVGSTDRCDLPRRSRSLPTDYSAA